MRSITRLTGASINTVKQVLVDAGEVCLAHHELVVREVRARRVQVDEIWSFTYSKQANVSFAKDAPEGAGDTWTWTAIDPDSKLLISYYVGRRDVESARVFMRDLAGRLLGRVQITSDGFGAYPEAVEQAFGADVDFGQVVKQYGTKDDDRRMQYIGSEKRVIIGDPDEKSMSTSMVERQNLTMRMGIRRFTRRTNAFSKRFQRHVYHIALYATWYNFCRPHKTLRISPAMAAGLTDELHDMDWISGMIEDTYPQPGPRGPYRKRSDST